MVRKGKRKGLLRRLVCFAWAAVLFAPVECRADLKSSDVLENSKWTLLTEYELGSDTANLQSICTTDTYIVCMINASNSEAKADTLVAFYKGGADEEGNPVTPYSYAMKVTERDYEHGNGMAYNPGTREIIISGGKNLNPKNKGCVFIVDADTLKFKRKVKVSNKWNVHAIDYNEDSGTYLIQKGSAGDYEFVEADQDFKIIKEIDMVELGQAGTFQDLCVCGSDIISLPYNHREKYNGNIQVYSASEQKLLGEYQLDLESDSSVVEAESISELSPGSFVLGCAIRSPRRLALYGATLPVTYQVSTSIEHGTITETVEAVDLGSDCKIEYEPDENYEVTELIVDGESINLEGNETSFVFNSMTKDHSVQVKCTEIPQFEILASAKHGTIDETQMIRRDQDVTVHFKPDEHYELDYVLVDGTMTQPEGDGTFITLENVQKAHSVRAVFKELPLYTVKADVKNGTVSETVSRIYEGDDCVLNFKPDQDYELKEVRVDQVVVDTLLENGAYRLDNVTKNHKIQVVYRWKYLTLTICLAGAMGLMLAGYLLVVIRRGRSLKRRRLERQIWIEEMREIRGE